MKRILGTLIVGMILSSTAAWAATVRLDLAWSVANTPSIPATSYRVDELVSGVWIARATVPSTQLTYSIPGRATGQTFSFSVMPLNGTVEGTRSNVSVCGTIVTGTPTTILTFSCTPKMEP